MYTKTEWASMYINMCTFLEKIVRFRYIVQNMLQVQTLVCANFVPFLTKTGLQRELSEVQGAVIIDGTMTAPCNFGQLSANQFSSEMAQKWHTIFGAYSVLQYI